MSGVNNSGANSRKPLLVRVIGGSRNQHFTDISPKRSFDILMSNILSGKI